MLNTLIKIINILRIVMIVITIIYWMLLLSIADSLSMAGALGGFLLGAILILMCVYDPNKNEDEEDGENKHFNII